MWKVLFLSVALLLGGTGQAMAHFGMLLPKKTSMLTKQDARMHFSIAFAHPFEQEGMEMEEPKFKLFSEGQTVDLSKSLKSAKFLGKKAWEADYTITKPGVYQFFVEPVAYFEPAEDSFIKHYTKVVLPAFGEEEGWDTPIGLPIEIVPITRPFGNYAGNVFQGLVIMDGKPQPNCVVEVEFYNQGSVRKAPNEYYVTQVVKTDANGVFTYAVPWKGWWGFAALHDAAQKMERDGTPKDVELGGVLWMWFSGSRE
ncbi:MAG: DUF4198 domain-containing protein [Desulfovibrio sp.]|nr:DUF4198 domain-containing protein [Desulfovibrio sp.]